MPLALALGLLGVGAFLWTVRSGQYDDIDGAAQRILMADDDRPLPNPAKRPDSESSSEPGADADS